MKIFRVTIITLLICLLAACGEETPFDNAFDGNGAIPVEETGAMETQEVIGSVVGAEAPSPVQPEPEPIATVNNPPCSSITFSDGLGGNLWKPHSERNGSPVFLLEGEWKPKIGADGKNQVRFLAQLNDAGFVEAEYGGLHNPDPAGLRQHFYLPKFNEPACGDYSGFVQIVDGDTKICQFEIPNKAVCDRQD